MNAKNFPCLAAIVILCGCVSDQANRYYGRGPLPPKPVQSVEVLTSAPTVPYSVVADFQCRGASPQDMQKLAAKIGADAVIVTRLGGLYASKEAWASDDSMAGSGSRIIGTAIKYRTTQ